MTEPENGAQPGAEDAPPASPTPEGPHVTDQSPHEVVRTRGTSRRRRRVLVVAGILAGWFAAVIVLALTAAVDIRAAERATDSARAHASVAGVSEGRPLNPLREARQRFERAHHRLGNPLLAPVRVAPVVGRQLRAVRSLAGAASDVADAGVDAIEEANRLLGAPSVPVSERPSTARRIAAIAATTDRRLRSVSLGPRVGLLAPIARARNQLAADLNELVTVLGKVSSGSTAVADLLTGPRRYLLFAANNAEMRAGSGMFLMVGEMETGNGGLRMGEMTSVVDVTVPPDAVSLPGDLADRWGWLKPNEEWRNLMLSPRFEENARLAADMWVAAGRQPVDGVVALDPKAFAAFLAGTGGVDVDGRHVDEHSVVQDVLHDQYARFGTEEVDARQEEQGRVARAVFDALENRKVSLPTLADRLAAAARGRHLLLWSRHQAEQDGWRSAGVAGALVPESLMVSLLNRSAHKGDPFLRTSAELAFAPLQSETEVSVRIRIENRMPVGEPRYIAGPNTPGIEEGTYRGILSVNLPGAAQGGHIEGVSQLAVAGADGPTRVLAFQFDVERDASRSFVVRFRLPAHEGILQVEPSARIPATQWTDRRAQWTDASAHVVHWRTEK